MTARFSDNGRENRSALAEPRSARDRNSRRFPRERDRVICRSIRALSGGVFAVASGSGLAVSASRGNASGRRCYTATRATASYGSPGARVYAFNVRVRPDIHRRYLGTYVSSRLGHCGLYVASSAAHRSPRCKEKEREGKAGKDGRGGEQRASYLFAPLYFLFKRYRRLLRNFKITPRLLAADRARSADRFSNLGGARLNSEGKHGAPSPSENIAIVGVSTTVLPRRELRHGR